MKKSRKTFIYISLAIATLSLIGCGSADDRESTTNPQGQTPTAAAPAPVAPTNTFGAPTGDNQQAGTQACANTGLTAQQVQTFVGNYSRVMYVQDPITGDRSGHPALIKTTTDSKSCLNVDFASEGFQLAFQLPLYQVYNNTGTAFRSTVFQHNAVSKTDKVTFELIYPYASNQVLLRFISCGMTGSSAFTCNRVLSQITFEVVK